MMYHLLFPLHEVFFPFNVFRYITFRSALAAVTAMLISFLLGNAMIRWLQVRQYGQVVRDDGPQSHFSKKGTPTMGGILILAAWLAPVLLWADLGNPFIWTSIGATAGFALIGLWDDLLKVRMKNSKGLSVRGKFLAQFLLAGLIAVLLWHTGFSTKLTVPFFKNSPDLGMFFIPFAMVVMVGAANAVNLTDGLDGLAIGTTGVALATFAVITYGAGNARIARYLDIPFVLGTGELAVFTAAGVGATIGFLWFNCHPAQIFMGDVGSMGLGGGLGCVAVLAKQEILLILVGGLFVLEALSVIAQVFSFKFTGRRVLRMAPMHHHFELGGWPESKVVIRFWILAILFALSALATLKLR
jgi:phospho-N-acetylmuramoyl-pentapeptide-transferase